jgi:hypothetical protein
MAALALMATGLPLWDALLEASALPGADPIRGVPRAAIRAFTDYAEAMVAFQEVAQADPSGANAALSAFLARADRPGSGPVTPRNFPERYLGFRDQPWVRSLPDGLQAAWLDLSGSGIETLPPGLRVEKTLQIVGCPHWDGRIPADTVIGGFLDAGYGSLRLEDWRRLHPDGQTLAPSVALQDCQAAARQRRGKL